MAGLLSNEINNTEKISVFVGECKRMGISILPPDINKSGLKFTPETWEGPQRPDSRGTEAAPTLNAIRYGLAAIKNVGEAAMAMAIRERDRTRRVQFARGFLQRGSIRAWPIAKCWKVSSRRARLILLGGIARSSSPASMNR